MSDEDDARRVAALHRLGILDSEPEERFDRLAALAALMFDAPIALVSLVDADRQWFKARFGLDVSQTDRAVAFCDHAIRSNNGDVFVVPDARRDERFHLNPLVVGGPMIRFYAGRVLRDHEGFPVGTLCVIDRAPRELRDRERQILTHLAALVEREFDHFGVREVIRSLDESERKKALILGSLAEGVVLHDAQGRIVEWNAAAERLLGLSGDELSRRASTDARLREASANASTWPGDDHPAMVALRKRQTVTGELTHVDRPDGSHVWLRVTARPVPTAEGSEGAVLTVFADVTTDVEAEATRRSLEDALRRSEELARTSLDALAEGFVLADGAGKVLRVNPAAQALLGYSAEELTERWRDGSWLTYDENGAELPIERRPVWRAMHCAEAIRDKRVWWTRQDGEKVLIRVSCVPLADRPGEVVVTFTDVTAERNNQRLLDAALEAAPIGLAVLDEHGAIVRSNTSFSLQTGLSAEELRGRSADATLAGAGGPDRQADRTYAANLLGGDERRVLRPDGSEVWLSVSRARIDDRVHPRAVLATVDVTAQRQMLHVLSRFGLLFRYANDIITVVDVEGQVLYVSPSNKRVLGYPDGFAHPDGVLGVVHPDDRSIFHEQLQAVANGAARPEPFTVRMMAASGEWRDMEQMAVSLLHEPAVNGIVLTSRDVTERQRLSRELAHRAAHDPLTGLLNRSTLEDRLQSALARAVREGHSAGLCFIDLDGFKSVNDAHGHGVGDELLVDVARRLRSAIRGHDAAIRMGGDEFIVILDGVESAAAALEIATRIRDEIRSAAPPNLSTAHFGASIGVAINEPGEATTSLLKRADRALYRAKARRSSAVELAN